MMYLLGSQQCSPYSFLRDVSYEQEKHLGADYTAYNTECCIREAIYNDGPVIATFTVYPDFTPPKEVSDSADWVYEYGKEKHSRRYSFLVSTT